MWNKNKKILNEASSYLEEGMILVYANFQVEILTAAAYHFLNIDKNLKTLNFFDIKQSPLTKKIHEMIFNNQVISTVEDEEKTIVFRCCNIDKGRIKLIIIKDGSSAEKMLNMGKEFVGNASHELRTPITIIKGFTEMLLEEEGILPSMQKSILKKMKVSCERMEHLVKHLLRLTDLENSNLEALAPTDIHRLIEDISYQVISIYPDVRIEHLRKEEDIKAYIDSDLMELVFTNLFKNAVKYSKDEKVIIVKVDSTHEDVYIQIKDKGIGIPEKDLEKIFDRFYTVDKAHCRKLGGAGLGLSIVRLIVNKHGGKVYATSILGESTTIHLHLPKAKDPLAPALR
jgi:two-component system phosphate regulon sensor histidine kinase PhoR